MRGVQEVRGARGGARRSVGVLPILADGEVARWPGWGGGIAPLREAGKKREDPTRGGGVSGGLTTAGFIGRRNRVAAENFLNRTGHDCPVPTSNPHKKK